jgi:glycosyltransferase involved in cell wall biosynthesis
MSSTQMNRESSLIGTAKDTQDNPEIVHVIPSIAEEAAGPSYSVPALCRALAERGAQVTLITTGNSETRTRDGYVLRACRQDYVHVPLLKRLLFSQEMKAEMTRHIGNIFHVHGLWLMPNIYPSRIASFDYRRLIAAPRGMLGREALEFSRRRKRIVWDLCQKSAIHRACCLHATSVQEYQEIRQFGLRQPVAVVRNGIDLPACDIKEGRPSTARTVLYLGRIHPKKGLDRLIAAWRHVEDQRSNWRLRIVGPDEGGYLRRLQKQVGELRLSRVSFEGPLYGDKKFEAYRAADLFVLPTLNEKFGITVAEALAHRTPVICTKGAPWEELNSTGCGWWVGGGVEALASALAHATSKTPEELAAMGIRGQEWMSRDFSWRSIAAQWIEIYRWVAVGGSIPDAVQMY